MAGSEEISRAFYAELGADGLASRTRPEYDQQVAENLLAAARKRAAEARVEVVFSAGSMTRLPYPDGSFDAAVCLWSAFHELLEEDAQACAVGELWRVLARGALALVEGPVFVEPTAAEVTSGERRGREHRVAWHLVEGILNPHYVHDEASLRRVCATAGVPEPAVFEREWAGRQRLFLLLHR
jgi:SAM-dependent methyltransferase